MPGTARISRERTDTWSLVVCQTIHKNGFGNVVVNKIIVSDLKHCGVTIQYNETASVTLDRVNKTLYSKWIGEDQKYQKCLMKC